MFNVLAPTCAAVSSPDMFYFYYMFELLSELSNIYCLSLIEIWDIDFVTIVMT